MKQTPTPPGGDLLHDEISRAAQAFADAVVAFDERTRERDDALADRDRAREQARQLRDELAAARSELSTTRALLDVPGQEVGDGGRRRGCLNGEGPSGEVGGV
ncbi:hypothetical protein XF36_21575 [Pseudonocardia sp. HH130629-09]|nr:hypothetical protein XF36_21575 [Pseudonocardia sp. HH130629-09]